MVFSIIMFTSRLILLVLSHVGIRNNAAFTHNGFDDQERNLTFVKTNFQVLKLKF